MLNTKRTVDSYEWTFELAPKVEPNPEELIDTAQQLKDEL